MSRILNTSLFYDGFTSDAGGGVPYMPGNIIDRIKRITNVEFAWNLTFANLLFDSATKTITMQNQYDNRTFILQKFQVDDTITIVNSRYNDGDYTITEISEDGKIITVAESIDDENPEGDTISVHGITPITAIDFYYNLIQQNGAIDFTSIVDPISKQKFTVSGLDATDSTAKPMAIGTKSFAWVTEKITDLVNNKTNAVYVKGMGIADYIQSFQITQFFVVTPFYLTSQFDNFTNNISPEYFPLKYICQVDGKYLANNPIADHTIIDSGKNGTGSWYDESALGTLGDYSVESITYIDNDTEESIDALVVNKNCRVEILINSKAGKFVDTGSDIDSTQFILGFNTCPSSETDYQNTATTQRQNFFQDSCVNYLGASEENGQQYGTGYQSITDCIGEYISAYQMKITYVFSAGAALLAYWESKEDADRYYVINLITQDVAITTTKATDRMTLKCDFQSASWNRVDDTLFEFVDDGLVAFKYPDIANDGSASIEGFQGDPFYAQLKFRIKQHLDEVDICTVQKITWEVVGEKTGKTDFVFESKIIDFSQTKKLKSVQQLDYSDTRGFVSYEGDPCNEVNVSRDSGNDSSEYSAYVANYGLILRYEYWQNAIQQFQYTQEEVSIPDISKDIADITQDWSAYDNIESWNLFLRFTIAILKTDNSTQNYYTQIPIVVKVANEIDWDGATGDLTMTNQFFNQAETEEIFSLFGDSGIVLIRTTMNGDFPPGAGMQYYGLMFATVAGSNIFTRRLASSEIPSESDSPFSAPIADESADFSWADGNVRINTGVKIVLESYFDTTIYPNESQIDIRSRIGQYKISTSS